MHYQLPNVLLISHWLLVMQYQNIIMLRIYTLIFYSSHNILTIFSNI
jgi:hypothetical protein